MGPVEIMPAAADNTMLLMPEPFPKNFATRAGFRNRFMSNMRTNIILRGMSILKKILTLLLMASKALSGIMTAIIP